MLDFLVIATRSGKRGIIEIYPKFIIKKSSDLMIRGGDFYAMPTSTTMLPLMLRRTYSEIDYA